MRTLLGLVGFTWAMLSTLIVCFLFLLEGPIELKAKPLWLIGVFLLLGATSAFSCLTAAFPTPAVPAKVKSKRHKSDKR